MHTSTLHSQLRYRNYADLYGITLSNIFGSCHEVGSCVNWSLTGEFPSIGHSRLQEVSNEVT